MSLFVQVDEVSLIVIASSREANDIGHFFATYHDDAVDVSLDHIARVDQLSAKDEGLIDVAECLFDSSFDGYAAREDWKAKLA